MRTSGREIALSAANLLLAVSFGLATLALDGFAASLPAKVEADSVLGGRGAAHQSFGVVALTLGSAKQQAEAAKAAEASAPAHRSQGLQRARELEIQRLRAGRR